MLRFVLAVVLSVLTEQLVVASVLNPSFEASPPGIYHTGQDIGGWTVGGHSVEVVDTWQAADGTQSADLSGNAAGAISQEIATAQGQWYTLRFAMAGNPAGTPSLKTMIVSWTSAEWSLSETLHFDTTGHDLLDMGWTYHEFPVYAMGGTAAVSFASADNTPYGPALDDVSLTPIPEPSTTICLLVGAVMVHRATRRAAN